MASLRNSEHPRRGEGRGLSFSFSPASPQHKEASAEDRGTILRRHHVYIEEII